MKNTGKIRAYIFEREEHICRCCRIRAAASMHELLFRSLGGKVSKRNSVAVCGDGVQGCHGFLQRHAIAYRTGVEGAEGLVEFQPRSDQAAEWMRVTVDQWVASLPGSRNHELESC